MKVVIGVATESVPEDAKKLVLDKPFYPLYPQNLLEKVGRFLI